MSHPLDDCRARLQRGRRQLQTLKREIHAFLEREPYRAFTDFEVHQGQPPIYVQRVHIVEPPDPEWTHAVSEILGNFRSSLDYMVCAMTRENGQTVGSDMCYPLSASPEGFQSRRAKTIGGLPELAQGLIEGWQPKAGDDRVDEGLSLLRDLSNFDKHQALHVMGSVVSARETRLRIEKTGQLIPFDAEVTHVGPFEDGAELQRLDSSAFPQVDDSAVGIYADFAFDVAFGEGGPGAGRSVPHSLVRIQEATVFLTGYFEAWFAPGRRQLWDREWKDSDPPPSAGTVVL